MFEKPFELLNRAVDRIAIQLEAADQDQRRILGEELVALRNVCDKFVERWLSFEERVAGLSEEYHLDLDGSLPAGELQDMQQKLASLQSPPLMPKNLDQPEKHTEQPDEAPYAEPKQQSSASKMKKEGNTYTYQVGDGVSMRPVDEQMVRSFRRGMGYFDLLMYREAMEQFKRVIDIDGRFMIARLYLAFGYVAQEEFEQAVYQLSRIELEEEDAFLKATVFATYGHVYAAQEQYGQALQYFETVADLMPDYRDVQFNLGCCQYNLGNISSALTHFQRALIHDGEDWEAHRLCALIWEQMGHRDRAYRHMNRAYDINGAQEQVLLEFAHLSELMGEREQARALYNKTLRYFPNCATAWGGLGWLKLGDGDVNGAFALFKKQLSSNPNDRQGIFNMGWALYQIRDYAKAERCFSQLLRRNGRDPFALSGLARTWSRMGKRQEAKENLLQLVASEGTQEKKLGLYHLGRLALEEESYSQALRYFNSALVYDRDCIESIFYKGVAHYALGEQERADHCFERCKMLKRDHPAVESGVGE
ncbi:MAG TPA: tetratricopeptide repeat protein [Bacilli bacterium]|nr:tetratricopeptide repeat protein [Bacilli bacterium]